MPKKKTPSPLPIRPAGIVRPKTRRWHCEHGCDRSGEGCTVVAHRRPPRDNRILVMVSCETIPRDDKSATLSGTWITVLGPADGRGGGYPDDPPPPVWLRPDQDVWAYLDSVGNLKRPGTMPRVRLLVVFGDARRDLALLGRPTDCEIETEWSKCKPHQVVIKLRSTEPVPIPDYDDDHNIIGYRHYPRSKSKRSEPTRRITVLQIGNLHPSKELSNELDHAAAASWLLAWAKFLRASMSGNMAETAPRQAVLSLSYRVGTGRAPSARQDDLAQSEIHRMEYAAQKGVGPRRVRATNGHYPKLYHLDFNAFYLRVMTDFELPAYQAHYSTDPAQNTVYDIDYLLRMGDPVVAEVVVNGRNRVVTTPTLRELREADRIDAMIRHCTYGTLPVFKRWARDMIDARPAAPEIIRPMAKILGLVLWGRLGQKNYEPKPYAGPPLDADDIDELIDARNGGHGPVIIDDRERFITDDGEVFETDPAAWAPQRFHAFAAHVLDYGERRLREAMQDVAVVYGHTDSIYSETPIPYAEQRPELNGDLFDYGIVEDVTFRGGARIVAGRVEADPATRPGLRWRAAHDDEDSSPGIAYFDGRTTL